MQKAGRQMYDPDHRAIDRGTSRVENMSSACRLGSLVGVDERGSEKREKRQYPQLACFEPMNHADDKITRRVSPQGPTPGPPFPSLGQSPTRTGCFLLYSFQPRHRVQIDQNPGKSQLLLLPYGFLPSQSNSEQASLRLVHETTDS